MPVAHQALCAAASSSSTQAQLTANGILMAFVLHLPGQLAPFQLQDVPATPCHTSVGCHHIYFLFVIPQVEKPASQKEPTTPYTVKLRGAPFNVTEVRVWKGRVGVPGSGELRTQVEPGWGLLIMSGDRWHCEDCFHSLPLVPGWRLAVIKGGDTGLGSSVGRVLAASLRT